ncbi:predicted protein [Streptomyces sp. AA4]|nr:predicted protein [Streptomyces sp. AA4]
MRPNVALGACDATNVALGACDATNVALGACDAPNVALGRIPVGRRECREGNPEGLRVREGSPHGIRGAPTSVSAHRIAWQGCRRRLARGVLRPGTSVKGVPLPGPAVRCENPMCVGVP